MIPACFRCPALVRQGSLLLCGLLSMFNARNEDERTPLEMFRRILVELRAERAEVAKLRQSLQSIATMDIDQFGIEDAIAIAENSLRVQQ